MKASHAVELFATPELTKLSQLIQSRLALPADEAARTQPEFERELRKATAAVERAVHAVDLARLDVDVPGIVVDGVRYRRRERKSNGVYMTMAGKVTVPRTTYRRRGGHGGETIAPLDLRIGLVGEHWTLTAAQLGVSAMTSMPSKEAAGLFAEIGTMTPSASHLDRLPKLVSDTWEADRESLEVAVREAAANELPEPDKVALVVISLDGIMLPMKDAPRTPGAGKLDCGPKGHREVGCATVSLYDVEGKRLHTIRFGRMPESRKVTLHRQLVEELRVVHGRFPDARYQAVADGARDNWRIIEEIASETGIVFVEALDYFHVVEHVAEGLRLAKLDADEIAVWRRRLRDDEAGVEEAIEELAVGVSRARGPRAKKIERELNYLMRNEARVDYPQLRRENYVIGSGVQEAACKTLVADRMKRSGMSWLEKGGQAILTLRGLKSSDRATEAWKHLRPRFVRGFEVDEDHSRQRPKLLAA